MKNRLLLSVVLGWTALTQTYFLSADEARPTPAERVLDLRPSDPKEWEASAEDIKRVLHSAAGVLWKYFPDRKLPPILIAPKGGPITLFKRGPNGELQVKLNTGKTLWAQYSFQFAHELCHILCDFKPHENPNHWFEESLCELASLFALRRMADEWKVKPPYANWKSYSASLKTYADERIERAKVPLGVEFTSWFGENEIALRKNSTDRPKNCIVAARLLPLFEKEPEMWEAVSFLNTEKLSKLYSFKQYLSAWRRNSPAKHRAFIDQIAKEFSIELER